jgi:hypothetical protein
MAEVLGCGFAALGSLRLMMRLFSLAATFY